MLFKYMFATFAIFAVVFLATANCEPIKSEPKITKTISQDNYYNVRGESYKSVNGKIEYVHCQEVGDFSKHLMTNDIVRAKNDNSKFKTTELNDLNNRMNEMFCSNFYDKYFVDGFFSSPPFRNFTFTTTFFNYDTVTEVKISGYIGPKAHSRDTYMRVYIKENIVMTAPRWIDVTPISEYESK